MPNLSDTRLSVSLAALKDNYRSLSATAAGARCAAVVKADAYGTGLEPAAMALADAGAGLFFVAQLSEATTLRQILNNGGHTPEIYVFGGPFEQQIETYRSHNIRPVLNAAWQIDLWLDKGSGPAALHIDTGMNRLGLSAEELDRLASDKARLGRLDLALIMSHLACADQMDSPMNRQQLDAFKAALAKLPPAPASLANSGGILLGPDYHFDVVRPGIALYGGNPRPDQPNPFRPVVSIEARILQLRQIPAGSPIGYGAAFKTTRPSRIAVLSLGYADGFLRALGNTAHLNVAGILAPVVGRVSMDLIAIDVTDIPEARCRVGDRVTVIGDKPDFNDLARAAGTISYELLTLLGHRFERVYVD